VRIINPGEHRHRYDVRARFSAAQFEQAFGPPHQTSVSGQIRILSWRCQDGTVDVICEDTADANSINFVGIDER
jgi:hypothetical protein